ncbi:WecB/TagA/CpsF family glycosyltransferase [Sanguibacter suaedae]|uniref:WecB/TagA/CpsF family glycosyltransferase n=1 Tax=Sanguibacter suaedae TaxID=2795737 RepID=A0A934MAV9_9MICO|nr:WecB/TagA/CpsF family glycosyltransferase [Sanguibacter suaedae]MBI9116203.1 WecB/TagA/CpsF family glycosyltransferase [Sanguibacter suaedae]
MLDHILEHRPSTWETLVTPNLHLLQIVHENPDLAPLYARADVSLADGWPVAKLAERATGGPVERVTGSDLFDRLVRSPGAGRPLVLVGGDENENLASLLQDVTSRGWSVHHEPASREELADPTSRDALLDRVASEADGGIAVIGLGAPKQEQVASELATRPGQGQILCLGMSINFSAGTATRAPSAIQKMGLEWAHRAAQEPARLVPRYWKDARILLPLLRQNRRRTA